MIFTREVKIRFQHCDPAGIVFYPRYFEMFNQIVEDWFDEAIGVSFQAMHLERNLGVPVVHIETDFLRASRIGDLLTFSLKVAEMRERSFRLRMEALLGDKPRVRGEWTLACVSLGEPLKSTPIPEDLRSKMAEYVD